MDDLLELDQRVLAPAIADEELERAATAEAVNWAYWTSAWQHCDWPQSEI